MPGFFGLPPEINSALLSSGPGAGPLLGSASAWLSLAGQYALAAEELMGSLAESIAVWEGPGAEAFRAAHAPMLAWLEEQSAEAGAAAARHTGVAAAYDAALAAMPPLAEIVANRTTLATLLGTNFLGINTIPIAVTEADYVRMWLQAASVMEGYQAAAEALTDNASQPQPAPRLLKNNARALNAQNFMQTPGNNNPDLLRLLELGVDDLMRLVDDVVKLGERAVGSLLALLGLLPLVAVGAYLVASQGFWLVWAAIFAAPVLIPVLLGTLIPMLQPHVEAEEPDDDREEQKGQPEQPETARPKQHQLIPVGTVAPPGTSAPASSTPAPQAPPAPSAPAAPAPSAPPGLSLYAVEGDWGGGGGEKFGPGATTGSSASSSSSLASAAAAAQSLQDSAKRKQSQAARVRGRARGRKVVLEEDQRMRADGHMDLAEEPALAPSASEVGGGLLGASGANPLINPSASGFQKLPDGAFQTGPTAPMLPTNWNPDSE
ncbi:PPE family protein [Segniliparus rotundus]|nr:PPE family protein [Segniliparus rotundus]